MRTITYLFLLILLVHGCTSEQSIKIESKNFEFVQLGIGICSCIHKFGGKAFCNVGIVDNENVTMIFDSSLSPNVAEELLKALFVYEALNIKSTD